MTFSLQPQRPLLVAFDRACRTPGGKFGEIVAATLNSWAVRMPIVIRVNMLGPALRIEWHPRVRSGQPLQNTTGEQRELYPVGEWMIERMPKHGPTVTICRGKLNTTAH